MVEILIADLVPLRQRASYLGLVSLSWALGSTAGSLVGSAFAVKFTYFFFHMLISN